MLPDSDAASSQKRQTATRPDRLAGTMALVLGLIAAMVAATGIGHDVTVAKKGFMVAVPIALVATFLGVAGWSNWLGKVGAVLAGVVLLGAALVVVLIAVR